MKRRNFFSSLIAGIASLPVLAKVRPEPRGTLAFDGVQEDAEGRLFRMRLYGRDNGSYTYIVDYLHPDE